MTSTPESVHADLVAWGVLEADAPLRFTRRFQGALARAASLMSTLEMERQRLVDAQKKLEQMAARLDELSAAGSVDPGAALRESAELQKLFEEMQRETQVMAERLDLLRERSDAAGVPEARGTHIPGNPVANQSEAALAAFLAGSGHEVTEGHRRFVFALQLESLPPAVREWLGV